MKRHLSDVFREAVRSLSAFPRALSSRWPGGEGDAVRGIRRIPAAVLALVETSAAGLALFVAGRMLVYPFLAAGASREWLARSWGGPSPIGATVVHWAVGAAIVGACYVVVRGMRAAGRRLASQRRR